MEVTSPMSPTSPGGFGFGPTTIKVLFAIYQGVNGSDVLGPLEVLTKALHNISDETTKAFECVFTAATPQVKVSDFCTLDCHLPFDQAVTRLKEFDILIIPGGDTAEVIKTKAQPLQLIKAFSDLQIKYPNKERTLMSIGTGSLLLAHQGILSGLSATTHPDFLAKMEIICTQASQRDLSERPNVLEERYVVNNLRFDLGNPDENPYIRRKSDGRRPSNARKGSNAWKESNVRRESNARRAAMKLGGLRVITSGGSGSGIDSSLYLVSIMVSAESAEEVSKVMQHTWVKGVVVDGIDI